LPIRETSAAETWRRPNEIRDRAVIEAKSTVVKVIVQLIRTLLEGIADLDERTEGAAAGSAFRFFHL
jgi:hypothetical protein